MTASGRSVALNYFRTRILFTTFLEKKPQVWKLMWAFLGCCIGSSGSPLHPPLGTFTPLAFSIYSSMGGEWNAFYSQLSQLISGKRNLPKPITINWIRTKVCFALLKLRLHCLRGSRTVCWKVSEFECDIDVSHEHAKFELHNSNILARPGVTSLSHLNYYICNLF